ncbi:MAG: phenylalanine--tRNA ligase subunit beta, partial [Patescibacteria group bacterium]
LKTKATPFEIGEKLSLTSLSVEKVEKLDNDFAYEMEVTTNRPDLFSVLGIAKETAAVLPQFGIEAKYIPPKLTNNQIKNKFPIEIVNDSKLVNRILAVVMEVEIGQSPKEIKKALEVSGIRSLNNVIDVTNYVARVIGHPTHVFDFDRLNTKRLLIREAKAGEKITTLDSNNYTLLGREIVAVNDRDQIVDLLGVMGLENSVVTKNSKRILYFIDNNEPRHIREASMNLGIRTDAAVLNEKGIDPKLAMEAMLYGISLFEKTAKGKQISEILDIYPNKPILKNIDVSLEKINKIIGVNIDAKKAMEILENLDFKTTLKKDLIEVKVPSQRLNDVQIEEDIIEEIARVYGYDNLLSILPPLTQNFHSFINKFYWEKRIKEALKYWGFIECYTYSFVSEDMYEGPIDEAVEINNPLTEDFTYMRNSLIPSLLKVISENKTQEEIKIFELANVYHKRNKNLPDEVLTLSGVIKKKQANFYEVKGIIEQLLFDLGIKNISFKVSQKNAVGASLYINNTYLGEIEVLDTDLIDFELNFEVILKFAASKKEYKPFAKYPPVIEDLSVIVDNDVNTEDLIEKIKSQSNLITDVSLSDSYFASRTFRIIYQDEEKNLTKEEVSKIRSKIISSLEKDFGAKIK